MEREDDPVWMGWTDDFVVDFLSFACRGEDVGVAEL